MVQCSWVKAVIKKFGGFLDENLFDLWRKERWAWYFDPDGTFDHKAIYFNYYEVVPVYITKAGAWSGAILSEPVAFSENLYLEPGSEKRCRFAGGAIIRRSDFTCRYPVLKMLSFFSCIAWTERWRWYSAKRAIWSVEYALCWLWCSCQRQLDG